MAAAAGGPPPESGERAGAQDTAGPEGGVCPAASARVGLNPATLGSLTGSAASIQLSISFVVLTRGQAGQARILRGPVPAHERPDARDLSRDTEAGCARLRDAACRWWWLRRSHFTPVPGTSSASPAAAAAHRPAELPCRGAGRGGAGGRHGRGRVPPGVQCLGGAGA